MKHAALAYIIMPPWKAVSFSPCVYMCVQNPYIEHMSLEVIMGCMFSGKSTELIRRVHLFQSIGKRVCVINHNTDT